MTRTYERRLGPHHFAFLRALAEGLDAADAARRYLGMDHGHELVTLQRQLVDQLRALARRNGDSRWRLIGIAIGSRTESGLHSPSSRPSLEEWAESEGLGDWSADELLEMYEQRFPAGDPVAERKARRNGRLRERQLAVLADLEKVAGQPARPTDRIDAWFDATTSERLIQAGCLLLQDLVERIATRGQWWVGVRATGKAKAQRIEAHLRTLLPGQVAQRALAALPSPSLPGPLAQIASTPALSGIRGSNRSPAPPRIPVSTDREAIEHWLNSVTGDPAQPGHRALTAAAYRREAERWQIFCAMERNKAMSSADMTDCLAYMSFLNNVPARWISQRRVKRLEAASGWTPFRTQPSLASRRQAVKIVHALCDWLVKMRYLDGNPWAEIKRGLVDGDEIAPPPTSRAFTREASEALLAALPDPSQPGQTRTGFIIAFTQLTGLRAMELLRATVGDVKHADFGRKLSVIGKGRKPRLVTLTRPAIAVLEQYLSSRGLPPLDECDPKTPLVASLTDPGRVPSHAAIHQALKLHFRDALSSADLPARERERMLKASQHWLRHTFATRAAEAGMAEDVLMAEMGHSSRDTTAAYYTAQERRRHEEMERVFGR
jgi:integrase/chorismate mutase